MSIFANINKIVVTLGQNMIAKDKSSNIGSARLLTSENVYRNINVRHRYSPNVMEVGT